MIRRPVKTQLQLDKLRPENNTYDVRINAAPGLSLRVTKSGIKSYRWDRGAKHTPRVITYGRSPALSLKDARLRHQQAQQLHADSLEVSVTESTIETVSDLATVFYDDRILPHRKRPEAVLQVLTRDILPVIGNAQLTAVSPLVARSVVKRVVSRGAVVHASRVLSILKQLFKFGVGIGVMEINPAGALEAINLGVASNTRDRVLDHNEIKQFWSVLTGSNRISIATRSWLSLLLLTGLRSGELRLAQWSDLDAVKGLLTIPVANQKLSPKQAKGAKPFVVPLDPFALSLFDDVAGADLVWIFPGNRDGQPMNPGTGANAIRKNPGLRFDPPFTPHDLRRTMRSNLSRLKVAPHVAERCLNHSLGKILETYDTHDFLDERRDALAAWSEELQEIIR